MGYGGWFRGRLPIGSWRSEAHRWGHHAVEVQSTRMTTALESALQTISRLRMDQGSERCAPHKPLLLLIGIEEPH